MWSFVCLCFFCKQKTAYEWRSSDWSSDVCSSDLLQHVRSATASAASREVGVRARPKRLRVRLFTYLLLLDTACILLAYGLAPLINDVPYSSNRLEVMMAALLPVYIFTAANAGAYRSEAHTSELPSLMRNTYAVFC